MCCDSLPLATDPGNACDIETALAEPVTTIINMMTNMIVSRITMIMITMVTMNAG